MRAWDRFDQGVYADEVLAHMDSQDFFISVSSPEALCALPRLGHRPRLSIEGTHDLQDIMHILPEGVQKIGLAENPLLHDLRPLAALRSLDRVGLMMCPEVGDLSPLADLGLDELYLHGVGRISGLDRLSTLRYLTVSSELPGGLRDLPHAAPLTHLSLDAGVLSAGGLLSALPALTRLGVPARAAACCPGAPELPGVESLWVFDIQGTEDLAPLARLCPNVRTVRLLTPLAVTLDKTAYASDFPGVEVLTPRSRPFAF
ncbi:hypothetical protein ABZ865_15645 [Streptomyces sp. NPDC047085]|uniref:hypothetical protein n=1 Tax=Streptomyces sp. NPDC047085 TaxID=3155140 RepID=UPI0033DA639B